MQDVNFRLKKGTTFGDYSFRVLRTDYDFTGTTVMFTVTDVYSDRTIIEIQPTVTILTDTLTFTLFKPAYDTTELPNGLFRCQLIITYSNDVVRKLFEGVFTIHD